MRLRCEGKKLRYDWRITGETGLNCGGLIELFESLNHLDINCL